MPVANMPLPVSRAMAVVMVSLVAMHGVEYLFAAIILTGIFQIGAGLLRLGKFIRLVPYPVMLGFVNGLAIVIFLAQLQQFQVPGADGAAHPDLAGALGHQVGDGLLCEVARRLQSIIRVEDTAARLSGDEFVVLLTDLEGEELVVQHVQAAANKILRMLAEPYEVRGHEIHVTVSIGIALYPDDSKNSEDLIKHADTAMYRAKEQGRNNIQFFLQYMQDSLQQRFRRLLVERRPPSRHDRAVRHRGRRRYRRPRPPRRAAGGAGDPRRARRRRTGAGTRAPGDAAGAGSPGGRTLVERPIGGRCGAGGSGRARGGAGRYAGGGSAS